MIRLMMKGEEDMILQMIGREDVMRGIATTRLMLTIEENMMCRWKRKNTMTRREEGTIHLMTTREEGMMRREEGTIHLMMTREDAKTPDREAEAGVAEDEETIRHTTRNWLCKHSILESNVVIAPSSVSILGRLFNQASTNVFTSSCIVTTWQPFQPLSAPRFLHFPHLL
jgi:hypothetical protein